VLAKSVKIKEKKQNRNLRVVYVHNLLIGGGGEKIFSPKGDSGKTDFMWAGGKGGW